MTTEAVTTETPEVQAPVVPEADPDADFARAVRQEIKELDAADGIVDVNDDGETAGAVGETASVTETAPPPSEEAAAALTPPGTEPPAAAPPPDLAAEAMRAENAQLRRQQAEFAAQQQEALIAQHGQQYMQQLVDEGVDTTVAQQVAQREVALARQAIAGQQQQEFLRGQAAAAAHYATQFGMPVNQLITMRSPQEMEAAGRQFQQNGVAMKGLQDQLAAQAKEIDALKKGRVTAQTFDSGQGMATGSDNSARDALTRYLTLAPGQRDAEAEAAGKRAAQGR